tara:strand:+ start:478 stop:681 length:204 start_codon:yes stop_codon:yes gene_type:complete
MAIKVSAKFKEEFKSYIRSVGVATVTVLLALVADIKPEYAILLGSIAAPIFKWIDPSYKSFGVNSDN